MQFTLRPLTLAVLFALPVHAQAETLTTDDVVVTAARAEEPLKIETDAKAPRQPVPAHDGADYLKTIPGFDVIRKGGSDGDPVFRGMAGSRLGILLDGEQILGGCGGRMDPPTAYIFPETYDRITVLKGPQTVLYAPGSSAATVLFERDIKRESGWHGHGALTFGSFGRNDELAQVRGGTENFFVEGTGSRSHSGNYEDGNGREVHSLYTRWSEGIRFGLTPDDNTQLTVAANRSNGQAAYADRSVDGSRFERENYDIKFRKEHISDVVESVEAQAYYNYIDHVMDNYTLRTVSGMKAAMNPDRETKGGRVAVKLALSPDTHATLGADYQTNQHTGRMTINEAMMPYEDMARVADAKFRNYGIFGELTHDLSQRDRLIGGLRLDRWQATDQRATVSAGMLSVANPTAGQERNRTLTSGFGRYEHDLDGMPATVYAGLGHTERFPDYWELISKESAASVSAFDTKPEKTTQLDVGTLFNLGRLSVSLSGFYNNIDDYILIQSNYVKSMGMMGTRTATITRNINATTWGGELGASYKLTETWKMDGSLAYVRGENDTDNRPLAQMTPLEGRLGLNYDDKTWSFGSLLRLVAKQDRMAVNQGNIVGQDIGKTGGFAVFSVNGGWRPKQGLLVAAGVDNLFNKTYAEHISRAGEMLAGFTQTTRVNEPGRMVWVKGTLDF
jgi:iron complex outermembrane receptor protein